MKHEKQTGDGEQKKALCLLLSAVFIYMLITIGIVLVYRQNGVSNTVKKIVQNGYLSAAFGIITNAD